VAKNPDSFILHDFHANILTLILDTNGNVFGGDSNPSNHEIVVVVHANILTLITLVGKAKAQAVRLLQSMEGHEPEMTAVISD
jgi:hypothetical protein